MVCSAACASFYLRELANKLTRSHCSHSAVSFWSATASQNFKLLRRNSVALRSIRSLSAIIFSIFNRFSNFCARRVKHKVACPTSFPSR
ncbi:MAG: hypothetical protein ACTS6G_02845 [Candidatus Hodgkinia cicadicola]